MYKLSNNENKIKSFEQFKEELLIDKNVCQECLGEEFVIVKNKKDKWERRICSCVYNSSDIVDSVDKISLNSSVLNEYIPKAYQEREFDLSKFNDNQNIPDDLRDIRLNSLGSLMNTLINNFKSGILPKKSYLINAPIGFGKRVFAFHAIKELLKCKKRPSTLLDLKTLQQDYFDKGNIYLNEVVLMNDVIFLEISPNSYKNDLMFLEQLANKCMNESVPLIIISTKSPYDLSEHYPDVINFLGINHAENFQYNKIVHGGLDSGYLNDYMRYLNTKIKGNHHTNNSGSNTNRQAQSYVDDTVTSSLLTTSSSNANKVSELLEGESIAEYKKRVRVTEEESSELED